MRKRILVVDDEPDLCEILRFNLVEAGYDVCTAYSAEEALAKVREPEACSGTRLQLPQFSLLLLDVMLPGMSGFEMAKELQAALSDECHAEIPIIFLTAKGMEQDRLHGFALGADDYITKPFSVREVAARVKAVLNRTENREKGTEKRERIIEYEGLVLNLSRRSAAADGEGLMLTKTEFELLRVLMERRGRVLSRQELMRAVWPEFVVTARTVDVNIARLRRKMGGYAECISVRRGYGYVFLDKRE